MFLWEIEKVENFKKLYESKMEECKDIEDARTRNNIN